MKGMRNGGRKVYESARENNERYQEYRQYKSRERQTREGLASDDTDSDIKEAAKVAEGVSVPAEGWTIR